MKKNFYLLIYILFVFSPAVFAQINVTPNPVGTQLAQVISGPGVVISNVVLNCPNGAAGTFTCASCSLGMDSGIVLTNGKVILIPGPNNNGGAGYPWGTAGDSDLAALINVPITQTYDACILTFDLLAQTDSIQFKYKFGSEEYPEYVCAPFNDVFGFFISGPGITGKQNIALIPGTNIPVSINSVNPGVAGGAGGTCTGADQSLAYSQYYINNGDGSQAPYDTNPYYIQYDGITTTFTAAAGALIPCQTYHLKLAIADAGIDANYDSGVFIEANSLSSNRVTFNDTAHSSLPGIDSAIRGCVDGIVTLNFLRPVAQTTTVNYTTGGTAVNGFDYSQLSGSIQFLTGDSSKQVVIHPTGNATQVQTVTLYLSNACSTIPYDSVTLTILPPLTVSAKPTDVSCFGGADGKDTAIITAGISPFGYVWSTTAVTSGITGLSTGSYSVTVTDHEGCTATASSNVSQAPVLTSSMDTTNVSCFGGSNGNIVVSPVGGTTPYTYLWSDGNTQQDRIGVPANTYLLTITDAHGCITYDTAVITQPTAVVLTDSVVNATCYGALNGAIYLTVTGGNPPYAYDWGTGVFTQNLTHITAGTYYPSATDNLGCMVNAVINVTSPGQIVFAAPAITNATCFGSSDGIVQIYAYNGVPPYTYTWNSVVANNPDSALAAGTYAVIVTDANNCTAVDSVVVAQPTALTLTITGTDAQCYAGPDGSAIDIAGGGQSPYRYAWSNGETSKVAVGLVAGLYESTVTDYFGCTVGGNVVIGQPTKILYTISAAPVKCVGSEDGTVTVDISGGGVPPYSYSATTNLSSFTYTTDSVIMGLDTGYYTVLIADNNGCTLLDTAYVPNAVPDTFGIVTDSTSCYGAQYTDGAIHISGLVGQNSPFQYKVDNSPYQFSGDFYQLAAGVHSIEAVNYSGCVTDTSAVIGMPVQGVVEVLPHDTTMQLGETVQLFSSFTNFPASSVVAYNWVPGAGLSCADCPDPVVSSYSHINNYLLTVTYNKGCQASDSARVIVIGTPQVFIPNSFSPNGDGNNDLFLIYGENIKTVNLKIFNRWGELVFNSENQFLGWDGNYKGQPQQTGVYVYEAQITFLDNTQTLRTGSVTLLR